MEKLIKINAVNYKLQCNGLVKDLIEKYKLPLDEATVVALPTLEEKLAALKGGVEAYHEENCKQLQDNVNTKEKARIALSEENLQTDFNTFLEERFVVKALTDMLIELDQQLQKMAEEKESKGPGQLDTINALQQKSKKVATLLKVNTCNMQREVKVWQNATTNRSLVEKYQQIIKQMTDIMLREERQIPTKVAANINESLKEAIAANNLNLDANKKKKIDEEFKKNNLTEKDITKPHVKDFLDKLNAKIEAIKAENLVKFNTHFEQVKKQEIEKEKNNFAPHQLQVETYKQNFHEFTAREKAAIVASDEARKKIEADANITKKLRLDVLSEIAETYSQGTQIIFKDTELSERNLFQFFTSSTLDIADSDFYKEAGDNVRIIGGCTFHFDTVKLQNIPASQQMTSTVYANMRGIASENSLPSSRVINIILLLKVALSLEPAYDLENFADIHTALKTPAFSHEPMTKSEISAISEKWVACIIGEKREALSAKQLRATDPSGQTLLHYCASFASAALLKVLCGNQTDAFSLSDQLGHLPLHIAAIHGNADALHFYLSRLPRLVNAKTHSGATALILASQYGKIPAVRQLLAFGAEANHRLPNGMFALYLAIQNDHPETALCLLETASNLEINYAIECSGSSPLHLAIQLEQQIVIDALIKRGADVTQKLTPDMCTPLHVAAEQGLVAASLSILATKKIDVNIPLPSGKTALHLAAANGRKELLRALLVAGANVNALTVQVIPHSWLPFVMVKQKLRFFLRNIHRLIYVMSKGKRQA